MNLNVLDIFATQIFDPSKVYWPYKAWLRGTRFGASSRFSEADAIQNTVKRLVEAVNGPYGPVVLNHRDWQAVVWRCPDEQWSVNLLQRGTNAEQVQILEANYSGLNERDDAVRHAQCLLAWAAWDGEEETSAILLHPVDQRHFGEEARRRKRAKKQ